MFIWFVALLLAQLKIDRRHHHHTCPRSQPPPTLSAYAHRPAPYTTGEPAFTTFHAEFKGTVDYLWFSRGALRCSGKEGVWAGVGFGLLLSDGGVRRVNKHTIDLLPCINQKNAARSHPGDALAGGAGQPGGPPLRRQPQRPPAAPRPAALRVGRGGEGGGGFEGQGEARARKVKQIKDLCVFCVLKSK